MKILITGCAGFIGFHAARYFSENGYEVVGLDNFDDYYDVRLKRERIERLPQIQFYETSILDANELNSILKSHSDISAVIHLAARPGARKSFEEPDIYIDVNIRGFQNLLDGIRSFIPEAHLVYASSSSVYGNGDHPKSLYGVSKISNEMMAHIYNEYFGIPTTGLRLHTVYGSWGRPDMAIYKFTKAIIDGEPLELYNMGENSRDFTHVDDVVQSIELSLARQINDNSNMVCDIGSSHPVKINDLVDILEKMIGKKAKRWLDLPKKGDFFESCANIDRAKHALGYEPVMRIEDGIREFVQWYLWYVNEQAIEAEIPQLEVSSDSKE